MSTRPLTANVVPQTRAVGFGLATMVDEMSPLSANVSVAVGSSLVIVESVETDESSVLPESVSIVVEPRSVIVEPVIVESVEVDESSPSPEPVSVVVELRFSVVELVEGGEIPLPVSSCVIELDSVVAVGYGLLYLPPGFPIVNPSWPAALLDDIEFNGTAGPRVMLVELIVVAFE